MDNSKGPIGPQPQFKEDSLNKKFSYSFTRRQLIILVNALRPIQLPLGDMRNRVLLDILDEVERTAIQSISADDYETPTTQQPQPAPTEDKPEVQIN